MPSAGDYNTEHSINASTVFLLSSHPAGSSLLGKDLVSGTSLTMIGSSVLTATWNEGGQDWRCLESVSNTGGGAYMATNATIRGISNAFTIFGIGDWDSFADWANLLCCPYNSTWASPFHMLGLARGGTGSNNTAHGYYTISGPSRQIIDGTTNSWPTTTGVHSFAVTRSGTTAKLFYDGTQVGSDLTVSSSNLAWVTDRELVIGNRNPGDQGEGIDGRFRRVQLWSRELTEQEVADLHADPKLGLYLIDSSTITLDTGAVAVAGSDLTPNLAVTLDTGGVAVAGNDLTILAPSTVELDTGAITVAGDDLSPDVAVTLDTGAVAVAGDDLNILAPTLETLDTGAIAIAGSDLEPELAVTLDTGAVAVAGNDLIILAAQTVTLDDGTVVASGDDLELPSAVTLDTGAVELAGDDVSPNTVITLDPGNIAIAGTELGIALAKTLDLGSIAVAGSDLAPDQIVTLDTGSVDVAGEDIDPVSAGLVFLDTGNVVIAGNDLGVGGDDDTASSVSVGASVNYRSSTGWLGVNDGDSVTRGPAT